MISFESYIYNTPNARFLQVVYHNLSHFHEKSCFLLNICYKMKGECKIEI